MTWLSEYIHEDIPGSVKEQEFRLWQSLIGSPSTQSIYEVGSGKAELISYLATKGHPCVATEITGERGEKYSEENVTWKNSDGAHLGSFEQSESYDVVLSDQVIEHIHPEDTQDHFRGVYEILKPNGK